MNHLYAHKQTHTHTTHVSKRCVLEYYWKRNSTTYLYCAVILMKEKSKESDVEGKSKKVNKKWAKCNFAPKRSQWCNYLGLYSGSMLGLAWHSRRTCFQAYQELTSLSTEKHNFLWQPVSLRIFEPRKLKYGHFLLHCPYVNRWGESESNVDIDARSPKFTNAFDRWLHCS